MSWQCILGIIMMVAGFGGVLVIAKKRNPALQPLAICCAVLMLVGLGLYGWFYMNPPPDTSYLTYNKAVANKIASELKGKKVVWVSSGVGSESFKEKLEVIKAAGLTDVTPMDTNLEDGATISGKEFKKKMEELGPDAVVVLDTEASGLEWTKLLGNKKAPKIVLGDTVMLMVNKSDIKKIEKNFGSQILFAIMNKDQIDSEFKPSDSDLPAAFDARYSVAKDYESFKKRVEQP